MKSELIFTGSRDAELFTKEISHSLQGAIDHLLDTDPNSPSFGFMQASFDGRPWTDTMWTRDAGVMLRELSCYGYLDEACILAECMVNMVIKNAEGFYTFPEHLDRGKPACGDELDGTASIVIGMVYLMRRLPDWHPTRQRLELFLCKADSPVEYAKKKLKEAPLIAGTGEFGGGCGIEGHYVNAVQNALVRAMLLVYGQYMKENGVPDNDTENAAEILRGGLFSHLTDTNGAWIWCVKPDDLQPDEEVLNHEINAGIAHLNDITAVLGDVEGLIVSDEEMLERGRATMDKHYSVPRRKFLFDTYGMWLQFDRYMHAGLTSPSYANGYAIQAMALTDRVSWLSKCVKYLAETTYDNITPVTREDKYWFYERMFAPDIIDVQDTWEGCGALNLVNVAEPLKAARLIAGIDCAGINRLVFAPRLPEGWSGIEVRNWILPRRNELLTVNAEYRRISAGETADFCAVDENGNGYSFKADKTFDTVRFGPFKTDKITVKGGRTVKTVKTEENLYFVEATTKEAEDAE